MTTAGTRESGCSDPLAAVARHAELTEVRVRRLLKSKTLTCVLTRVNKSHCSVPLEGECKGHRKRLPNLERMDHSLEDGTAGIEDKLLQSHNVNNFISKGKFPGPRPDSTNSALSGSARLCRRKKLTQSPTVQTRATTSLTLSWNSPP